ncbi:MAG: redoxin family protein [Solobacterium sp.]|nr:redoxin family protein [Solobacterium sp.]
MGKTEKHENLGFNLTYPDTFENTKGALAPFPMGGNSGVYVMMFNYIAATKEELDAMEKKTADHEPTQEEVMQVMTKMGIILTVVGIDGGRGINEILKVMRKDSIDDDMYTVVGKCEDITYYAITDRDSDAKYMEKHPDFAEEFQTLQKALIEVLKNAEYYPPHIPGVELIGRSVHFETTDTDGNPVKSEELFAAHAVTMINFWATWCNPCKNELEELGNIHRRVLEKDAAIVGYCTDADEKLAECKALMAEKNLTYTNLLPAGTLYDDFGFQGIPTSIFVNREGKIMTYPVIGAPTDLSEYDKIFEKLLAQVEAGVEPVQASETASEKKNGYRVVVTDSDGAPVPGASLQFCSDTTCMMGRTDAEGAAFFETAEGHYTVHVMKVPEGYLKSDEEYTAPETYGDVNVTLKKA